MLLEIRVPPLPESIADATLVAWHKQPGEIFKRDEVLANLETDKVVLDVTAPFDGVLMELKAEAGTTVLSDQVVALSERNGEGVPGGPLAVSADSTPTDSSGGSAPAASQTPAVRSIERNCRDNGKSVAAAPVPRALSRSDSSPGPDTASKPAAVNLLRGAHGSSSVADNARKEERAPMSRLRARIAERLLQARATQALLTSFNEVDLMGIRELRGRYKDHFEKTHGVRLGYMAFFVKASVEALKRFPILNARVEDHDVIYHNYYDIGVAVSTERGLVVPVVRDADRKGFADVEREIAAYAAQARDGIIAIEDLFGGTFTVTNGGVFGSLLSTPIVNSPQSAILGMHKIQERPMVANGSIVIRPMMYLAITYDHRIIDGREAIQFLTTVKECLENPGRMLLGL